MNDLVHIIKHTFNQYRAIYIPLIILAGINVTGVLGYMIIEGWPFVDALYMTLITITTVGYGETNPLTPAGRLLTMGLIVSGVSVLGYGISVLMAFLVEGEFATILKRRSMLKEINQLENHVIVCGAGDTGRHVVNEFSDTNRTCVIIDIDPECSERFRESEHTYYLEGDAIKDQDLLRANIEKATGLIAALPDDKDNVFVVLSARALNPNLTIVAKAISRNSEKKILNAGADYIVSPNFIGGMRMASIMLRPQVVNFLDQMLKTGNNGMSLRIEEVIINKTSEFVDSSLSDCQIPKRTGLIVVAIKQGGKNYLYNPPSSFKVTDGDIMIVMGDVNQVQKLRDIAKDVRQ